MVFFGWAPDFPTPHGLWFPTAHGAANQPNADINVSDLDDPRVNGLIDRSLQAPADQWDSIGRQLDDAIMEDAVYVPLVHPKNIYWRSERLTNVYSTWFTGQYDVVNLGVSHSQ